MSRRRTERLCADCRAPRANPHASCVDFIRDYGIDDSFIKRIRDQVTEGTSALFVMTSEAVVDRVTEAMKSESFEIIATNLSHDEERKLREAFAQHEPSGQN